jgi:hypothetical protein
MSGARGGCEMDPELNLWCSKNIYPVSFGYFFSLVWFSLVWFGVCMCVCIGFSSTQLFQKKKKKKNILILYNSMGSAASPRAAPAKNKPQNKTHTKIQKWFCRVRVQSGGATQTSL